MFKKYSHKAQAALEETKDKSDVSDEDEKVQQAGRDLKTFVERVSNKSLDDVIKAAQKVCLARLSWLINRPQKTFRMTRSSRSTSEISRLSLIVSSTSPVTSAASMYDDGQSLIAENPTWKGDAAELQKQLEGVVNGIVNDGPSNKLVSVLENLSNSLATAGQIGMGSLKVDGQGLYRDFMDVIVPRLIGLVKEIPVPRVEFKSEGESDRPDFADLRHRPGHRRHQARVRVLHSRLDSLRPA